MSEYYFASFTGSQTIKGGKKTAAKRSRIARKVGGAGCGYTYYYDDARKEWRGWGYCPNLGHPFDRDTALAIQTAWASAGV